MARAQTVDKACKRKNPIRSDKKGWDSCLLCWLRLQNAVIYVWVNSLFAGLPPCLAGFLNGLQSVDFVNILYRPRSLPLRGRFFSLPRE